MSAKVISIVNNKGGVGKTTSTKILGELMAFLGLRVLHVDLDPQNNLTMFCKLPNFTVEDSENVINGLIPPTEKNLTDIFKFRYRTKEEVTPLIRKTSVPNMDILPSSKRHKKSIDAIKGDGVGNTKVILKKALAAIRDDYDFILIDNAPASDELTVNSLITSDYVLTPVRMEGFSYRGLIETLDTIAYIKREHDLDNLTFLGTFITQAEPNTNIYKNLVENYENELGSKFFKSSIRRDIKIPEIELHFESILQYAPNTNAVYDYSKLLLEMDILDDDKSAKLREAINE